MDNVVLAVLVLLLLANLVVSSVSLYNQTQNKSKDSYDGPTLDPPEFYTSSFKKPVTLTGTFTGSMMTSST